MEVVGGGGSCRGRENEHWEGWSTVVVIDSVDGAVGGHGGDGGRRSRGRQEKRLLSFLNCLPMESQSDITGKFTQAAGLEFDDRGPSADAVGVVNNTDIAISEVLGLLPALSSSSEDVVLALIPFNVGL
ncbi:hypothetical protein L6452_19390 [Arctium lappa]|uniref:Uncharacterized protein n=1 Tax=Arctium lappa TaxID=4217 RepID=A0ACB9B9Q8_ARCLA|nr:hypothetical protein L6452_19390 [Arctium lappa]